MMPFLVRAATGIPIDAPTFWITAHRRVGSQPNTLFNELRSLMVFYLWADLRNIDIEERISGGTFFELAEIIDLVNVCGWFLDDIVAALSRRSSNVSGLLDKKKVERKGVQGGEKRNRVSVIRSFLEFTTADHLSRLQSFERQWVLYRDMRQECLDKLSFHLRSIPKPSRDDVGSRQGLPSVALERVRKVIEPDNPENPFEPHVRFRNFVIVRLLLDLGIRRGELLGLLVEDCDLRGKEGFITIHRRPDNPDDVRQVPVAAKTAARKLALSPRLTEIIFEWIVHHRSKIKGARTHGFLIVALPSGVPMSPSNINKMFEGLRKRVSDLPPDFAPHVLRHSWNDTFSEHMDKMGVSEEDEAKWRKRLMGWRSDATAANYLRRTVERRSNEVLKEIQEKMDVGVDAGRQQK